ncbi:MAG: glycosyltransferase family 4 protein [Casimicrobiaceae bacterium]
MLWVATHPIQYQVPLFQAVDRAGELDFEVLFIQQLDAKQQGVGFGVAFEWDIPLLEGYRWRMADGVAGRGGLEGFAATWLRHPLRLLRRSRPDVLVLSGWHALPLVQLLFAATVLRIPVVMRGESNALRVRPWQARVLHRGVLAPCSAFLAIGRANADFYRGYGIPPERLFDAPYFVDNRRFAEAAAALAPERDTLRARWHVPLEAASFLYAGKLEPKKRILDLLAAFERACARTTARMHLLVVGTGALMAEARDFVETRKLPVHFAGFLNQTEMPAAYMAADALVLPSDYGETWGLVVNEAMACGRPALVSDRVGCGPDLIVAGHTGDIFPFGDVDALAGRLVEWAQDVDRLRAMGACARERVTGGYSVERAVAGLHAAVHAVRRGAGRA